MWLQDSWQLKKKGRDNILPYTVHFVLHQIFIGYLPWFISGSSFLRDQFQGAERKSTESFVFPWSSSQTWPYTESHRGICLEYIPGPCLWRFRSPVWSCGHLRGNKLPRQLPAGDPQTILWFVLLCVAHRPSGQSAHAAEKNFRSAIEL